MLISSLILPSLDLNAWAFTFNEAVNISNTSDDSINQRLAVADEENIYTVWEDGGGDADILFAASTDSGDSFSTPDNISNTSPLSTNPQLAVAGNDIYVVWRDDDPGNADIFFATSTDSGDTFTDPVNISDNAGTSDNPQIVVSDDVIYVAWEDNTSGNNEILFSMSDDGGDTFTTPVNISNSASSSTGPELVVLDDVYVIWKEDIGGGNREIFFSKSTDNGDTFTTPVNISNSAGFSTAQTLIADSGIIYVVWGDEGSTSEDIFFSKSTDNGDTFTTPDNISDNAGSSFLPQVTVSNNNVYVIWVDDSDTNNDIFFSKSTDNGDTFTTPVNISDNSGSAATDFAPQITVNNNIYVAWEDDTGSPGLNDIFLAISDDDGATFSTVNISNNDQNSRRPRMATAGSSVYVAWEHDTGLYEIFVRAARDLGPPSISIESVSDSSPLWGLDSIEVSGFVNGNSTDTITIDWGDGDSDPIAVDGSSWGPISHLYNSSNTGTREITATLLDEFGASKADDSVEIDIQKHETSLSIDNIFSVEEGSVITATGTLTDTDASAVIAGATITFSGTGADNLLDVPTDSSGDYESSGASPSAAELLTVQVHFAGNTSYLASDSETISYDAVALGTTQFDVFTGTPSPEVTLTEFNASIVFDSVLADGVVYVSECDAPASTRYEEIADMCLSISPAVSLEEGSGASITMSYDGLAIPAGYSEDDIDLFHEGLSGIVDITESRDTEENTVTGRTADFSKFIGGAALHSDAPVGAVRQQVFVGDDNYLLFEFTETKTISFADAKLTIGDSQSITVTDPYANLDSAEQDTINATVTSTSDSTGITVTLAETGAGTGIFTGVFVVRGEESSGTSLKVRPGDSISASYEAIDRAPFRILIEGVTEAGIAEVVGFDAPDYINPVGDSYELRLIDAALGPDANVTVTMSYENVPVDFDPLELRILRMDGNDCEEAITFPGTTGHDTAAMTVKGNTDTTGEFALALPGAPAPGLCPAIPGGGGGGLPRPGTGIVLDAIAGIAEESSAGGGRNSVVVIRNEPEQQMIAVETFPERHFEDNPLGRIEVNDAGFMDAAGNEISEGSVGNTISIASTFSNRQQKPQDYSFIAMIIDEDGFAVDIAWQEGTVKSGQIVDLSISWMPQDGGNYTVKMFVWDGFENPSPLSNVTVNNINVV